MNYIETDIKGVFIIEPKVFEDARGYFMEAWKQSEFEQHIGAVDFIQDMLDAAVDIRRSSPTFGKHVMVELSEDNKRQFFIPRGFAHGFLVLSEEAVFTYKVDNVYAPQAEAGIRWDDKTLDIKWPIDPVKVITSDKDLRQPAFADAVYFE